jgi:hypothetical protein
MNSLFFLRSLIRSSCSCGSWSFSTAEVSVTGSPRGYISGGVGGPIGEKSVNGGGGTAERRGVSHRVCRGGAFQGGGGGGAACWPGKADRRKERKRGWWDCRKSSFWQFFLELAAFRCFVITCIIIGNYGNHFSTGLSENPSEKTFPTASLGAVGAYPIIILSNFLF